MDAPAFATPKAIRGVGAEFNGDHHCGDRDKREESSRKGGSRRKTRGHEQANNEQSDAKTPNVSRGIFDGDLR
jgi:hypothetical protein